LAFGSPIDAEPRDCAFGVFISVLLVRCDFRAQALDVLIDQADQELAPLGWLPVREQVEPSRLQLHPTAVLCQD
jgi:hypothetical protein